MSHSTARLDQLLARLGYGTRREVESLIHTDRVLLDGEIILDSSMKVALEAALVTRLTIDGEPLDPLPGMVVMLNKPLGMTCSHKESGALVYDLFPRRWLRREPKLSSIGRLDKETSGLLLFTDDGGLLHRIISPKQQIAKCYHATLSQALKGDEAALFASGTLMLEGETTPLAPAKLEVLGEREARLIIHEGRYHQVRRMFAATGNRVVGLKRLSIGGLALPEDLAEGQYRLLTPEEIALIFNPA